MQQEQELNALTGAKSKSPRLDLVSYSKVPSETELSTAYRIAAN